MRSSRIRLIEIIVAVAVTIISVASLFVAVFQGVVMQRQLEARQARLHSAARALNAVSPLAVLGRGYAIAQDEQGQIVRRAQDTQPGQLLKLKLGEGRLSVEVKRRYQK